MPVAYSSSRTARSRTPAGRRTSGAPPAPWPIPRERARQRSASRAASRDARSDRGRAPPRERGDDRSRAGPRGGARRWPAPVRAHASPPARSRRYSAVTRVGRETARVEKAEEVVARSPDDTPREYFGRLRARSGEPEILGDRLHQRRLASGGGGRLAGADRARYEECTRDYINGGGESATPPSSVARSGQPTSALAPTKTAAPPAIVTASQMASRANPPRRRHPQQHRAPEGQRRGGGQRRNAERARARPPSGPKSLPSGPQEPEQVHVSADRRRQSKPGVAPSAASAATAATRLTAIARAPSRTAMPGRATA